MALSFQLTDFEGPLDLLLYLISKHKLDILDIEISELLRQYLTAIEEGGQYSLETKSEFLEMAARLVHIKTLSLLPKHEEEAEKLRSALSGELMEYHLCKRMAGELSLLAKENLVYVRAPMPIALDLTYRGRHSAALLYWAQKRSVGRVVRKRPPEAKQFEVLVTRRVVSVNSRIIHLLRLLYKTPVIAFANLFAQCADRSELVATFLATLELAKAGRVAISPDGQVVTFHKTKRSEEAAV